MNDTPRARAAAMLQAWAGDAVGAIAYLLARVEQLERNAAQQSKVG